MKRRCIVVRLLLSLLPIVLLPLTAVADDLAYNNKGTIETSHKSWMSWINNAVKLSSISMPGTHDTMALVGGDLTETQQLTLEEQLNAGIRFVDIRARHSRDSFYMYHGPVYQWADFDDVLLTIKNFLAAHPSETILMKVKEEYEEYMVNRKFWETFAAYRDNPAYSNLFLWGPNMDYAAGKGLSYEPAIPTIGDARGKIVLIQDFNQGWNDDPTPEKIYFGIWWDKGDKFKIQNNWELCCTWEVQGKKWPAVQAFFEQTETGTDDFFYANYLSATGAGVYPLDVAGGIWGSFDGINNSTLDYLFNRNQRRTTGIVVMDFPGAALIDVIIAHNMGLTANSTDLDEDFNYFVTNLSHSLPTSGSRTCEDRATKMHDFFEHVMPAMYWDVLCTKNDSQYWGHKVDHEKVYGNSGWVHGYKTVVYNSRTLDTSLTDAQVADYVNSQIGSLSGDRQQQAEALHAKMVSKFPGVRWSVVANAEKMSGFDNWATMAWVGASHSTDYSVNATKYQVFSTSRSNYNPEADAGGSYTANEGSPVYFDASVSRDLETAFDALQFRWDVDGDGVFDTNWAADPTASYTWMDDFSGNATVEVSDGVLTDLATAKVTILNVVPSISVVDAVSLQEGQLLQEQGSFADPGNDTWTGEVDYGTGDGFTGLALSANKTFQLSKKYRDNGTYTLAVKIQDDDSGPQTAISTVSVANVAPQILNSGLNKSSISEGQSVTLTGAMQDPGLDDNPAALVDWGDGGNSLATVMPTALPGVYYFQATHTYIDDGTAGTPVDTYVVGLRVQDKDKGYSETSHSLDVANVPPLQLSLSTSAQQINENSAVLLSGTFADPGVADDHKVEISWGDGSKDIVALAPGVLSFANIAHTYVDDNPSNTASDSYTIDVRVVDKDTGETSAATAVTVVNLPPEVTSLAGSAIDENGIATVSGTFSDAGIRDTFTLTANWRDGSSQTVALGPQKRSFSLQHRYRDDNPSNTAADTYMVGLSLVDDDGGRTEVLAPVLVRNIAPDVNIDRVADTLTGLTLDYVDAGGQRVAGDMSVLLRGVSYSITGSYADTGGLDTHQASINWADGRSEAVTLVDRVVTAEGGVQGKTATTDHTYLTGLAPGSYTAVLTLSDDDRGVDSSSARLTVVGPVGGLEDALADLNALLATGTLSVADAEAVSAAIIGLSGDPANPDEEGAIVLVGKGLFMPAMRAIKASLDSLTLVQGIDTRATATQLVLVVKSMLVETLDAARKSASAAITPDDIRKVETRLARGDSALAQGLLADARTEYEYGIRILLPLN